jgi:rubrerythrin
VATETNNLALACAVSGGRLAHLLEEWNHPTKRMKDFTPGSSEKVPWMCRECGWPFYANVYARTKSNRPTGCPACAGKVATETNNLALACKESRGRLAHLPGEWNHPTKRMEDFLPASHEKVPWRCRTCEGEWDATISDRTRSDHPTGCPVCNPHGIQATETHNLALACAKSEGRLAHLLGEWNHPTKRMEDFTPGSGEKVPWRCGKCGWEWNAAIKSRTSSDRSSGCPACAGKVATETHNLALACEQSGGRLAHLPGEWNHPTKRMEDFTPGSSEQVPWRCKTCEREWDATINSRTKGDRPTGCPECNVSGQTCIPFETAVYEDNCLVHPILDDDRKAVCTAVASAIRKISNTDPHVVAVAVQLTVRHRALVESRHLLTRTSVKRLLSADPPIPQDARSRTNLNVLSVFEIDLGNEAYKVEKGVQQHVLAMIAAGELGQVRAMFVTAGRGFARYGNMHGVPYLVTVSILSTVARDATPEWSKQVVTTFNTAFELVDMNGLLAREIRRDEVPDSFMEMPNTYFRAVAYDVSVEVLKEWLGHRHVNRTYAGGRTVSSGRYRQLLKVAADRGIEWSPPCAENDD